jgi:hypothetical protein
MYRKTRTHTYEPPLENTANALYGGTYFSLLGYREKATYMWGRYMRDRNEKSNNGHVYT